MSQDRNEAHWENLLKRLAKSSQAMVAAYGESEERTKEILDARARTMAAATQQAKSNEQVLELVHFRLGSQRCGILTRFVLEVLPLPECTPLPGAPPHFAGVCNLRGQILLVADLARLFAFSKPAEPAPAANTATNALPKEEAQLLVLGNEHPELGILALGTCQTLKLLEGAVSKAHDVSKAALGDCLFGISADGLVVLDGQALLHDARLYLNQA